MCSRRSALWVRWSVAKEKVCLTPDQPVIMGGAETGLEGPDYRYQHILPGGGCDLPVQGFADFVGSFYEVEEVAVDPEEAVEEVGDRVESVGEVPLGELAEVFQSFHSLPAQLVEQGRVAGRSVPARFDPLDRLAEAGVVSADRSFAPDRSAPWLACCERRVSTAGSRASTAGSTFTVRTTHAG